MMKNFVTLLLFSLLLASTACKNEFDKLRATGDVKLLTKKSLEYYEKGDYSKAQSLFELIMPSLKGQNILEEISYKYAYTHFFQKNYGSANFYFKNFATTFANSPLREDAEFQAAYSDYKQSPTFRLDQDNSMKAIEGFQYFTNNFPESKRVKECNKLIDEMRHKMEQKAYDEGTLYYNLSNYQASIQVFENLLKDFPETSNAEDIRFLILKAQYEFAKNSIYEKQLDRFKLVLEKYKDFKDKYPSSRHQKDAENYLKIANNKIKEFNNVRHQNQSSRS
ncbi:MAG: outer membrane protein assembly factor BamD [Saprospiraceae bacterium]|nr:outer membrane protein assembly factor BamD [Saprospiraceae bacterium]